jgi:phosphoribosylformylglycinamidine (FGAM) synthase-like amidotransferase family enzyme
VLFKYCDEAGNITSDANPNGSLDNIAGICNIARNVFGFMPHPERASDSLVANEDGLAIFESILSMVKAG